MKVLLDTCVISELRRANAEPKVRSAIERLDEADTFLSIITIGEISFGAHLLDEGRQRREIMGWLHGIERDFSDRILGINSQTAWLWGRLTAAARRAGQQISTADGLIAATARYHELRVMTRNIRDFASTGVQILNPWLD